MKNLENPILKLILIYITFFATYSTTPLLKQDSLKHKMTKKLCKTAYDEDFNISAISYNVWALPIKLPGHNQNYRFSRIGDSLLTRDFEIICLQEVFNPKVRANLLKKLSDHYFTFSDYSCNQPILGNLIQRDCHGGLMTLSKYPIIQEKFYAFNTSENSSLIEKIGHKGFMLSTILWNNQLINIVNTHLYAGNSSKASNHRMKQIMEIEYILNQNEYFRKYPTVLFGDLNTQYPFNNSNNLQFENKEYHYLTHQMGFKDSYLQQNELHYTINPSLNSFGSKNNNKQKLDYIMIHVPEKWAYHLTLLEPQIDFYGPSSLSDHMGWKANIKFNSKKKIDI